MVRFPLFFFFFFNDTATTEIYTLSLHDALPIYRRWRKRTIDWPVALGENEDLPIAVAHLSLLPRRSEEHTSELQSRQYLVCRLLLEKKKKQRFRQTTQIEDGHVSRAARS